MKKAGGKKLLIGILFVGLLFLSLSLVAAQQQEGILKSLYDAFFSGVFSGTGDFFNSYNVAKILLILLVVMLVYSVSDFIPVVSDKEWVKWAVSAIVGVLSFLLVDKQTIEGILTTYTALGVVLTSIVPLIILLAFHYKIVTNVNYRKASPLLTLVLGKFLFLLFALWVLFRWYSVSALGTPYVQAYLGAALFAFLWVFIGDVLLKKLSKKARKAGASASMDEANADHVARLLIEIDDLSRAMKGASASEKARLKERIEELKKLAEEVASR